MAGGPGYAPRHCKHPETSGFSLGPINCGSVVGALWERVKDVVDGAVGTRIYSGFAKSLLWKFIEKRFPKAQFGYSATPCDGRSPNGATTDIGQP